MWGRWHDGCLAGFRVHVVFRQLLHLLFPSAFAAVCLFALGQSFAWASGAPCGVDGRHLTLAHPHQGACRQATFEADVLDNRVTALSFGTDTLIVVGDALYRSQGSQIICQ